jgi:hypothetical protein
MDAQVLSNRRKELEARADQEKLEWKYRIEGLKDDRLVVLALATALGFNLRGALDPSKSLAELDRQRKEIQATSKHLEALWRAGSGRNP